MKEKEKTISEGIKKEGRNNLYVAFKGMTLLLNKGRK